MARDEFQGSNAARGADRQEHTPRPAVIGHRDEVVLGVEARGAFVLRVDDDARAANDRRCIDNAPKRVEQQLLAEPSPLCALVNGEASDQRNGHRVLRQLLLEHLRHLRRLHARHAQR